MKTAEPQLSPRSSRRLRHNPRRVAWMVALLLGMSFFSWLSPGFAQTKKQAPQQPKKESYTRPAPTTPIKPQIPAANRYQDDKVFLEKADSLYAIPTPGAQEHQIVKGNVVFRQGGTWMYCDSAYYYPAYNSMDAFGHVKMVQGDTLFVYADKLFYNGNERRARLRCGPSQPQVKLQNRNTTLTTDSLDYNLFSSVGECNYGLKIDDKVNTLTSNIGVYDVKTKDADFYYNVVLTNNKDGYKMFTDTLYYNTHSHIASIVSRTTIEGKQDTILTSHGWYNTSTGMAELNSRSTILHRDSAGNVTTLEGDSLIYDKLTHITRAYTFRDPMRNPRPMVLTDTANHMTLIGGFGLYNDSTQTAYATEYPLLIEYSRPDSLFLRADTIRTFIEKHKVFLPLTPQQIATRDSILRMDSVIMAEWKALVADADSITKLDLPEPPVLTGWQRDSAEMVWKDFHVAQAYNRARFFSQDVQGVADSIVFVETDSLLHMHRKPVVWSGERQVYGHEIIVHLNDSTADWALLPDYGMMGEHVEEDFYNQLTGKTMKAYFENKTMKRLEAEGNVMTIFLPQENDSTYNKLVNVESSYLTIDLDDRQLEKLKMWPEVTGEVIPLFIIRDSQKYLQGFVWLEAIRPKREWYGNRWVWIDELGEVPPELEQYFLEPPIPLGQRSK